MSVVGQDHDGFDFEWTILFFPAKGIAEYFDVFFIGENSFALMHDHGEKVTGSGGFGAVVVAHWGTNSLVDAAVALSTLPGS